MINSEKLFRVVIELPFSPSNDYLGPSETQRCVQRNLTKEEADNLADQIRKDLEASGLDVLVEEERES